MSYGLYKLASKRKPGEELELHGSGLVITRTRRKPTMKLVRTKVPGGTAYHFQPVPILHLFFFGTTFVQLALAIYALCVGDTTLVLLYCVLALAAWSLCGNLTWRFARRSVEDEL